MLRFAMLALFALAVTALAAPEQALSGRGDDGVSSARRSAVERRYDRARSYFTDLPVVTQNGETLRFFSDLLRDKVVVATLFYSECTSLCPDTNRKLAGLQNLLGERQGTDIILLSVSIDPETDTPDVLKAYAGSLEARAGWYFVTGDAKNLETIAARLGHQDDDIDLRDARIMAGSVKQARWKLFPPDAAEAEVAGYLLELASDS